MGTLRDRRDGVVLKLGGSVVTDKAAAKPRVREDTVRRLGREIVRQLPSPLVLVHGAGSFGHQIVARTGLHLGLREPRHRFDLGETQRLQYELDSVIARILLDEGLPVMPCQASASAVMGDGTLERMDLQALTLMLEQGLVPLLYGVPAMDRVRGCSILSGDQIAPYVALQLGIGRLVHATNVDGVYDRDPGLDPAACRIDCLTEHHWEQLRGQVTGSQMVDVTGGMAGKVEALLDLAQRGVSSRIIDANIPGNVEAALSGESVGTLVQGREL